MARNSKMNKQNWHPPPPFQQKDTVYIRQKSSFDDLKEESLRERERERGDEHIASQHKSQEESFVTHDWTEL